MLFNRTKRLSPYVVDENSFADVVSLAKRRLILDFLGRFWVLKKGA